MGIIDELCENYGKGTLVQKMDDREIRRKVDMVTSMGSLVAITTTSGPHYLVKEKEIRIDGDRAYMPYQGTTIEIIRTPKPTYMGSAESTD